MFKGNSGAFPDSIRNNICELDAERCHIEIGVVIEFELDFYADHDSEAVVPSVKGYLGIISIPLELSPEAQIGCDSIYDKSGELGCPLIAGEFYTYKMDLNVTSLPISGLDVDVEVALDGDNGRHSCFRFPAKI